MEKCPKLEGGIVPVRLGKMTLRLFWSSRELEPRMRSSLSKISLDIHQVFDDIEFSSINWSPNSHDSHTALSTEPSMADVIQNWIVQLLSSY